MWNVQFVKVLNYNIKSKGVGKVSTGEKLCYVKGFGKIEKKVQRKISAHIIGSECLEL